LDVRSSMICSCTCGLITFLPSALFSNALD
jgi:hypothetical protein